MPGMRKVESDGFAGRIGMEEERTENVNQVTHLSLS